MMSQCAVARLPDGSRRDRLVPVAHMAPEPGHAQAVSPSSEVIHAI